MTKKRTGVFVCHCGTNIAATVDVAKVAKEMAGEATVAFTQEYVYMCSEPGQESVVQAIKDNKLDSVVVTCCSPNLHEKTFRDNAQRAGINNFTVEIANIREQCSWVHQDKAKGTEKAIKISRSIVRRVNRNKPLDSIAVDVVRRAMVVGGGIAGIQAALDIANAGIEVILVEKQATIGGRMLQLSETFPTLDCAQCVMSPKMVEVKRHPRVKLMTYSEVQEVTGSVGNFRVKVLKKSTFVDPDKCKLCDHCTDVCPVVVPNEFEHGLTQRRAIFIPYAQAIPASYTLDLDTCLGLNPVVCGKCKEVCLDMAIDYDMQDQVVTEDVGAIVVATGFDLYDQKNIPELGGGKIEDVLDGFQFERLCSASGATGGHVLRPSDHKVPKEVVFIQCVGSRDPAKHCAYCSKICCMYTAKHARLYKKHVPDGRAYIFYIDIRSGGKGYEEFVQRTMEDDSTLYLRGRVSKLYRHDGKVRVHGTDTLTGQNVEIDADMVVLALAMVPSKGTAEIAKVLKVGRDKDGFMAEAHPKLRPVESVTGGIYLAGAAQAPKDIPETVAQAGAAAAKVIALLSQATLSRPPLIAKVRRSHCTGCGMCVEACPFIAIRLEGGKAIVNEALCEGCGSCSATCLRAAIDVKNVTQLQIYEMIEACMA